MKPTRTHRHTFNQKSIEVLEEKLNHTKEVVHSNGITLEHMTHRPMSKASLKKVYHFVTKHILLERFIEELINKLSDFKNEMKLTRQMRKFSGLKTLSETFKDLATEVELLQEMQFNVTKSYIQFITKKQAQPATTHLSMVA